MEIRCPKCNGDKFSVISADSVKCAYCGHVYSLRPMQEKEPQQVKEQEADKPQTGKRKVKVTVKGSRPKPPVRPKDSHIEEDSGEWKGKLITVFVTVVFAIAFTLASTKSCNEPKAEPVSEAMDTTAVDTLTYYDTYDDDTLDVDDEAVDDYDEEQAAMEQAAEGEVYAFIRDVMEM